MLPRRRVFARLFGSVAFTIEPYVPAGLPYASASAEVPYFFTEPDAFRTERAFSTDVSAHYRYQLPHAEQPSSRFASQTPRTFRRSFGVRF